MNYPNPRLLEEPTEENIRELLYLAQKEMKELQDYCDLCKMMLKNIKQDEK